MISFVQFLVVWNQIMGLETPAVHFRIAEWLETAWKNQDRHLLLMAFRSCGKSTLVGIFAAWLLFRHPALRILVVSADHALAKKMVRTVKRMIERHSLTAFMKPEEVDQWAGDSFTVRRDMELRDPSMMAKGLTANITGCRADVIIYDDVEVPNTCGTAGKRADLRERLAEISYVMAAGGTQLYVGTPHTYYSIYADEPRTETGEDEPFLLGYKALKVPLLDGEGNSAWPERYDEQAVSVIQRQSGPNKFASQMMLMPLNIVDGRLDTTNLHFYEDELDYVPEISTLFLGSVKLVAASAWWDPAFGGAGGDRSVLAVVYTDEDGRNYLHRVYYISADDLEGESDEASKQCAFIARVAKELRLPSICVEINGIGKFLPSILRNALAKAKASAAVEEITSRTPKDIRILEAFDAILAAENLSVHKSVCKTPFMTEMQEWQPETYKGHDDGLDAVAGALSRQPVRIKRLFGGRTHKWTRGRAGYKARSDFKV